MEDCKKNQGIALNVFGGIAGADPASISVFISRDVSDRIQSAHNFFGNCELAF